MFHPLYTALHFPLTFLFMLTTRFALSFIFQRKRKTLKQITKYIQDLIENFRNVWFNSYNIHLNNRGFECLPNNKQTNRNERHQSRKA